MSKVRVLSSKLVKPAAPCNQGAGGAVVEHVPLTVFDRVTFQMRMAEIYAFAPPAPSTAALEAGLAAALAQHRLLAGQLVPDAGFGPAVVLNDHGASVVEASVDGGDLVDMVAPARQPGPELLALHPDLEGGTNELVALQLTRFRCGSLALGFTINHAVADGRSVSCFLADWGRATRGVAMGPPPVYHHQCGEHAELFRPRPVPRVMFDHRNREYYLLPSPPIDTATGGSSTGGRIVVHKAHFRADWIARLRASVSEGRRPPFSRFEAILAHLWRAITRARGLRPEQTSTVRVSVDGRDRLGVPAEYFGNLVLWAFPTATAGNLRGRPLRHAAQVIHDEVATVADAAYFRSFVDFAGSGAVEEEGLAPTAALNMRPVLSPDLEVHSLLTLGNSDLDFGTGKPTCFMPAYFPEEGTLFLVPSCSGDGGVDAFVALFHHDLDAFKQCCYSIDIAMQHKARI